MVAVFGIFHVAGAQDFPVKPTGFVNDYGNMISQDMQNRLEQVLAVYRDSTSNVIVIATFPDLQGIPVEEFATKVFNTWRMWEGDRYNGVLILASRNDRKLRIEVGYGLEGAIPDALAGRIIQNEMAPRFRSGDFDGGFASAVLAVMKASRGEYQGTGQKRSGDGGFSIDAFIVLFLLAMFLILVVIPLSRAGKRKGRTYGRSGVDVAPWIIANILSDIARASHHHNRRGGGGSGGGWGGGGGFGGFGGGGGFGSGGGGASGGW